MKRRASDLHLLIVATGTVAGRRRSVDVGFQRLVSEDETADAGVERGASPAWGRIEAEREPLEKERETRRQLLAAKVDEAIARILADAAQDVAAHRARRERWLTEQGHRGNGGDRRPAGNSVTVICGRPRKKTL